MRTLWQFVLFLIWLGAIVFALTKTQYPGAFMVGTSILIVPLHLLVHRMARKAWPMKFARSAAEEVASSELLASVWIGLVLYIIVVSMDKAFFGLNSRDMYYGFLFGSAICLWHYFWRFLSINWSPRYMLCEAFVPVAVGQVIAAAAWRAYLFG